MPGSRKSKKLFTLVNATRQTKCQQTCYEKNKKKKKQKKQVKLSYGVKKRGEVVKV